MNRTRAGVLAACLMLVLNVPLIAQEKRAKAPSFGSDSFRGVFFDDIGTVVASSRPSVTELRGLKMAVASAAQNTSEQQGDSSEGGTWSKLAAAESIEGEIKRVKLMYDANVAQPGAFKSGGYVKARLNLSILSTLFAVIVNYDSDVRFKKDAQAARNLLSRTYRDCNSGSIQVFNQCKSRKADLDDLMNGSSISSPAAEDETDWSKISDRSLMMQYLEILSKEELPNLTNNDKGMQEDPDSIRQFGDMVALVGHVLTREGMDDAEDDEYAALAKQMTDGALQVSLAVERGDSDGARRAVGMINQACEACHEQYR